MTKDEALKLALEALGNTWTEPKSEQYEIEKEAITAIKEALAQPEQEPVGIVQSAHELNDDWLGKLPCGTKLYTAPPQRPWVGLTQQDIDIAFDDTQEGGGFDDFARAIEAKLKAVNGFLKEKNT